MAAPSLTLIQIYRLSLFLFTTGVLVGFSGSLFTGPVRAGGSAFRVGSLRVGSLRVGWVRVGSLRVDSVRVGWVRVGSLLVGGGSFRCGRTVSFLVFCVSTGGGALRIGSRVGPTLGLAVCGTKTSGFTGSERTGGSGSFIRAGLIGSLVTAPVFLVAGTSVPTGSGRIGVRSPNIFVFLRVGSSGSPLPDRTVAPIGTLAFDIERRGLAALIESEMRPSSS